MFLFHFILFLALVFSARLLILHKSEFCIYNRANYNQLVNQIGVKEFFASKSVHKLGALTGIWSLFAQDRGFKTTFDLQGKVAAASQNTKYWDSWTNGLI